MIKVVDKKWGTEEWIVNRDYCAKLMTLNPDHSCSFHFHKDKTETFYVLEGTMDIKLRDLKTGQILDRKLIPGDSVTIYPLQAHSFKTVMEFPCKFIEVSTHHDDADTYRIEESK